MPIHFNKPNKVRRVSRADRPKIRSQSHGKLNRPTSTGRNPPDLSKLSQRELQDRFLALPQVQQFIKRNKPDQYVFELGSPTAIQFQTREYPKYRQKLVEHIRVWEAENRRRTNAME